MSDTIIPGYESSVTGLHVISSIPETQEGIGAKITVELSNHKTLVLNLSAEHTDTLVRELTKVITARQTAIGTQSKP